MNKNSKLWYDLGGKWSDKYWNHNQLRGKQLVDYFKDRGVKSFLEIGCNSGRNLWYLSEHLPDKELSGLEISPKAAADARIHVPKATIYEGDVHDVMLTNKYDVVYTGGVLLHIEPELVSKVISKMISFSNKYVVHMEPIGKDIVEHGPKEYKPLKVQGKLRCLHDLERIYRSLGYTVANKKNYLDSKEAFIVLEQ